MVKMVLRNFGQIFSTLVCASVLLVATVSYAQSETTSSKEYTDAAVALYEGAEHLMDRKDYEGARRRYQTVAREYPFSIYAAQAELRIGDAYFKEKSYGAAVEAYRAFSRLRPRHERVPYADYQIVDAYVRMMPKQKFFNPPVHERDLTDALLAYREARRYIIRYKEGEYTERAKETLSTVADRLAQHEVYVAEYYERRDKNVAAMRRYAYLVSSFPESKLVPSALLSLAEAAEKTRYIDNVREAAQKLQSDYPESKEQAKVQQVLARAEAFAKANPDAVPEGQEQEENDPDALRKYKGATPRPGGGGGGMGGGMGSGAGGTQMPGGTGMPY